MQIVSTSSAFWQVGRTGGCCRIPEIRDDDHCQAEWIPGVLAHGSLANEQPRANPRAFQRTDLPSWLRRINRCPTSPLQDWLHHCFCISSQPRADHPFHPRALFSLSFRHPFPSQRAVLVRSHPSLTTEVKLSTLPIVCTWPCDTRNPSNTITVTLASSYLAQELSVVRQNVGRTTFLPMEDCRDCHADSGDWHAGMKSHQPTETYTKSVRHTSLMASTVPTSLRHPTFSSSSSCPSSPAHGRLPRLHGWGLPEDQLSSLPSSTSALSAHLLPLTTIYVESEMRTASTSSPVKSTTMQTSDLSEPLACHTPAFPSTSTRLAPC